MPANREAVEQLAQRLEEAVSQHNHDPFSVTVNHRLANLAMDAAALLREPQGEPVAWRVQVNLNGVAHFTDDFGVAECRRAEGYHVTPLFAAPAARQHEQEPARIGHDEAQALINRHVRGIEILCDQFGYDPFEWIVVQADALETDADARQPDGFTPITQLTEEDREEAMQMHNARSRWWESKADRNPNASFDAGWRAALASPPAAVGELERAYLAGFNASGEGYNGEYPFGDRSEDPAADPDWCAARDAAIRASVPGEPK